MDWSLVSIDLGLDSRVPKFSPLRIKAVLRKFFWEFFFAFLRGGSEAGATPDTKSISASGNSRRRGLPAGGEGGRLSVALESPSVPFGGKLKLEDDDETFPSRVPSLSIKLEATIPAMDCLGGLGKDILALGSCKPIGCQAFNVECLA